MTATLVVLPGERSNCTARSRWPGSTTRSQCAQMFGSSAQATGSQQRFQIQVVSHDVGQAVKLALAFLGVLAWCKRRAAPGLGVAPGQQPLDQGVPERVVVEEAVQVGAQDDAIGRDGAVKLVDDSALAL